MSNETTNFNEPPKPGAEFLPIDPDKGIDAVYCCKCVEENHCVAEKSNSAISFAYGQFLVYRGTSTSDTQ